jgi:hypothetical protein
MIDILAAANCVNYNNTSTYLSPINLVKYGKIEKDPKVCLGQANNQPT